MRLLKADELTQLISNHGRPCISLYLRFDRERSSDAAHERRFQDLVHQAGHLLNAFDSRLTDGRLIARLTPLRFADLLNHSPLRQGFLSLFLSPAFAGYVIVDDDTFLLDAHEQAFVADQFHLIPILPLLQHDDEFLAVHATSSHFTVHRGNAAEFQILDRIPFALDDETRKLDQTTSDIFQQFLASGIKAEVANHLMAEYERHPDVWHHLSMPNFLQGVQRLARLLRSMLQSPLTPLIICGPSEWTTPLHSFLTSCESLRGHTLVQLPALTEAQLPHRARTLVKALRRQQATLAWQKARQTARQHPCFAGSDASEIINAGRMLFVTKSARQDEHLDESIEAILGQSGHIYVLDNPQLLGAANAIAFDAGTGAKL